MHLKGFMGVGQFRFLVQIEGKRTQIQIGLIPWLILWFWGVKSQQDIYTSLGYKIIEIRSIDESPPVNTYKNILEI